MLARTLVITAALALAGCATADKYSSLNRDFVKDDQGHVVGERESLRNERTGAVVERVEIYIVLLDADGKLVGYEQRLRDGSIVRDIDGRPIGVRYLDLRSRATNARAGGLLLLY